MALRIIGVILLGLLLGGGSHYFAIWLLGGSMEPLLLQETNSRICCEYEVYWGVSIFESVVGWAGWIAGFSMSLVGTGWFVTILIAVKAGTQLVWNIGSLGLVIFRQVRVPIPILTECVAVTLKEDLQSDKNIAAREQLL